MDIERTKKFKKQLAKLDKRTQETLKHAIDHPEDPQYRLKKMNPSKKIGENTWRIIISRGGYRAIVERHARVWKWIWVGSHEDYNKRN